MEFLDPTSNANLSSDLDLIWHLSNSYEHKNYDRKMQYTTKKNTRQVEYTGIDSESGKKWDIYLVTTL